MMETPDKEIWAWVKKNQCIIISKDEDFVILHNTDDVPVALIWLRVGNTRRKALLEWFLSSLPQVEEKLYSGETLIELI